jgi:hypothetical protein
MARYPELGQRYARPATSLSWPFTGCGRRTQITFEGPAVPVSEIISFRGS